MTVTTEPNRAIGAVRTLLPRCTTCGAMRSRSGLQIHTPACPDRAQDPAGTGPRGVNSAVGTNAGNPPICFPPEPSGLMLEKLAGENIGSLKC